MDPGLIDDLTGQAASLNIEDAPQRHVPQAMGYEMDPPPPPKIHSKGIVATDITEHFRSACQELPTGLLIKDHDFTLFESVGAIELMDSKMDTGYLAAGETLEDHYDVGKRLTAQEVIGVLDQLLCLEMAWHMGHPLSQTLFTSLHIDHLFSVEHPDVKSPTFGFDGQGSDADTLLHILRAYCLGLLKTCWHVNNRVRSEHFYEEEDFVTHVYNRNMLEHVPDASILCLLRGSKERLAAELDLSDELREGLDDRLNFRISFLETVAEVDNRTSTKLGSSWRQLKDTIIALKIAQALGKPVLEAFSEKVQRKLASTVPPRPTVVISFADAHEHLTRLCADGETVSEVLTYYDSQSLLTFVSLFQCRKPEPSVYIRTLLQYYLFGDMMVLGRLSIRQVLDDDLAIITLPANILLDRNNDEIEATHDPRHVMAQRMEDFRTRAAQSYLDVFRTLCQNRCRIRRTLHHAIADWENLQLDAEDLDVELRAYTGEIPIKHDPQSLEDSMYAFPLSSWAYYYKLRCMENSLQLGFELSIFQPWEFSGLYYYLNHITTQRTSHLLRIQACNRAQLRTNQAKGRLSTKVSIEFERSMTFLGYSVLESKATSTLAGALHLTYAILLRIGAMPNPQPPYSDAMKRYELRMKPFVNLSIPPLIPYKEFDAITRADDPTASLEYAMGAVELAKRYFGQLCKLDPTTSRCRWAWSEEIMKAKNVSGLRSCILLGIALAAIGKGLKPNMAAGKDGAASNGEDRNDAFETIGKSWKVDLVPSDYWWIVPQISVPI